MHTQECVGLVAYAGCGHVRLEGTCTPGEDTHSWLRTRILRQLLDFITRENASLAPLAHLITRVVNV